MNNGWQLDLPDSWSYKTLPELISYVVDNRGRTAPTAPSGIPLIATNCISNSSLYPEYKNLRYVSQETYDTWFRGHPRPGDIIFVNKGTPGLVCMVPDPVDFCFAQDMVALRPNIEVVDGKYLFAALRSQHFAEQVKAFSVGTTIPHLKKSDFPKLIIPIPSRKEQEFIGNIYYRISRKIEINRRINRTLEAMAQALFKHWFVDFGPFQDEEFVESELGLIPKGWMAKPLSSLIKLLGGGTPTTKVGAYWDGDIDWVTAKDVAAASPFIMFTEKRITSLGVQNSSTKILPKFTTIITARGTVGECGLLSGAMAMNQTNYGIHGAGSVGKFTTYLLVEYAVEKLKQHAYGTVFDTITSRTFDSIIVPAPPSEVWVAFEDTIRAWFEEMLVSQKETEALTATRDYLLPKLLSGEVGV